MAHMTKKDVCAALGINKCTLRDWERKGIAPYSFVRFGRYYYEKERVRKFIEDSRLPYRSPKS